MDISNNPGYGRVELPSVIKRGDIMFGIGMPELIVIALIALLVVGPKKLPELAKSLGKGLAEFRKVTDSATDTIKETLKTEEIKKDMDSFKDSLLADRGDAKESPASASPADSVKPEEPQTTAPKPQA